MSADAANTFTSISPGRSSDFRFILGCVFPFTVQTVTFVQRSSRLQRRAHPGFAPGSLFTTMVAPEKQIVLYRSFSALSSG